MEEVVDGEYQAYKAKDGGYVRKHFFGKYWISRRWLLLAFRRYLRSMPGGFRVCLHIIWNSFEGVLQVLLLKIEIISQTLAMKQAD